MKHIPNILSIIRLLLVPVFIALYTTEHNIAAVIVFVAAGITDVLDGYLARKYDCTSVAGKVLDPLADKLMQFSAFICLYLSGLIPFWMPVIYFIKELLTVIGAAFVFKKSRFVVKSNIFGKTATVLVFAAVCVIMVFGKAIPSWTVNTICAFVCVYFVFSCLMYAYRDVRPVSKKRRGA